jgi:phosphatidylserine/phosphatidylglycerophosphate/cardiolipin synthase-like enzyme
MMPNIPEPLSSQSYYVLDSEAGYQALHDALLDQGGVEPRAVGGIQCKLQATGEPLSITSNPGAWVLARPSAPPAALDVWREKLDFLLVEDAVCVDLGMKFRLKHLIIEARSAIAELEATSPMQGVARQTRRVWWKSITPVIALLLIIGAIALFKAGNAPRIETLTAGSEFSIFAKPEEEARIIARVSAGERFDLFVNRGSNNWAFVRYCRKKGWVMAQDLSVVTPIDVARGLGFRGSYWQIFFTAPQPKEGPPNEFGIDARFAQAITRCKSSLDIAIYELDNLLVTRSILDAHTRGVRVRIVTDERSLEWHGPTFDKLRQSGITVVAKRKGSSLMHSKYAILDNACVWTGSWNYTDGGTFRNNENVIAIDSAEIAAIFAHKFQRLFEDGSGRTEQISEATTVGRQNLPHGVRVFFAPEDPTLGELRTVLSEAKTSIRFMTFSFTVEDIAEILQRQAAKKVTVRGIVEKSLARSPAARSLLTGSVPELEVRMDRNPRFLRHNCVIVDDRVVLLGSMNISFAGSTKNDENMIVIPDPALAAKFIEEFERLWKTADGKLSLSTSSNPDEEDAVDH